MRKYVAALFMLSTLAGCHGVQTTNKALDLSRNTSDLYYKQVLDNLALILDNPSALPHFNSATQGTGQVQRSVTGGYTATWDLITAAGQYLGRYLLDHQTGAAMGMYTDNESWQLAPTNNPDKLYLMRCAYLHVIGNTCPDCEDALFRFYRDRNMIPGVLPSNVVPGAISISQAPTDSQLVVQTIATDSPPTDDKPKSDTTQPEIIKKAPQPINPYERTTPTPTQVAQPPAPPLVNYYLFLQRGWFGVGKLKDVPLNACYVGKHCKTYVWVTHEQFLAFANFTLAIMDIASIRAGGPGSTLISSTATRPGTYGLPPQTIQQFIVPGPNLSPRETNFPYPAPPTPLP